MEGMKRRKRNNGRAEKKGKNEKREWSNGIGIGREGNKGKTEGTFIVYGLQILRS